MSDRARRRVRRLGVASVALGVVSFGVLGGSVPAAAQPAQDEDPWSEDAWPPDPPTEQDAEHEARVNPKPGTCLVVVKPKDADGLPETLVPPDHPESLGETRDLTKSLRDSLIGGDSVVPHLTYCYRDGAWLRRDTDLRREQCSIQGRERRRSDFLLSHKCWGSYPTDNYDIGFDEGAWNHLGRKFYGWSTDLAFSAGKFSTGLALWSTTLAYEFDISKYNGVALEIGNDYRANLTENPGFRLAEIAWFVLIAWAAVNALRGRLMLAAGEIAVSILLLTLSAVLMANRPAYMSSTWNVMDRASTDLLVAGSGENPTRFRSGRANLDQVLSKVHSQVHKVFVEQPYDHLNWGRLLDGKCAETRNMILATGPHGADDMPRMWMRGRGCRREADFNHDPNGSRLMAAVLVASAAIILAVVMIGLSLTIVVAKFAALLLFVVAPLAVVVVALPGNGRRLAWLWLTSLLQAVTAVVGMSLLLSVLMLGVEKLLRSTVKVGLVERFAVVNLAVLALAMARRRLLAGGSRMAGNLADRLASVRLGAGASGWARGSSSGFNLLNVDRGMLQATWGGAAAGAIAGRVVAQRRREKRARKNIVKARRTGDREQGIKLERTYSSPIRWSASAAGTKPRARSGSRAASVARKRMRGTARAVRSGASLATGAGAARVAARSVARAGAKKVRSANVPGRVRGERLTVTTYHAMRFWPWQQAKRAWDNRSLRRQADRITQHRGLEPD